jgi:hypothetical protein
MSGLSDVRISDNFGFLENKSLGMECVGKVLTCTNHVNR